MDPQEYATEFDEQVRKYNEYLEPYQKNKEPAKKKDYWKGLLEAMVDVFDIFGFWDHSPSSYAPAPIRNNPIYFRNDLSPEQKDAILLGSDYQRVNKRLDKIISGETIDDKLTIEEAKICCVA